MIITQRLYNLNKGQWFRSYKEPEIVGKFIKMDGMYAHCLDVNEELFYYAGFVEVEVIDGPY